MEVDTPIKRLLGVTAAQDQQIVLEPEESNGFEGIASAKAKTVNNERQIQALVDKKKVVITESTIKSDLHLDDAEVQAPQAEGESLAIPTDPHPTHSISQPSLPRPQKKQSRRKQRKDTAIPETGGPTESMADDTKEHQKVLDLETSKAAQAQEISSLKQRVKKLEKKKIRPHGLKRLFKVGSSRRVESFDEGDEVVADKEVAITADPIITTEEEVTTVSTTAIITPEDVTL
ncbi:hypothetical protein Tco_1091047 [Tanacetum coccineum]|uniref:Uncharacterized protein n=1 Tax=Tanacetum coccineum TaxID=301880 RepID=A0ABQ5I607_9ASTR